MSLNNTVRLTGRLGKDAEIRNIRDGVQVINLSMATSERYRTSSGEQKEHIEWHDAYKFGKNLEKLAQHLKKGTTVTVEGALRSEKWEKSGVQVKSWKVKINELQFNSSPVGRQTGVENGAVGADSKSEPVGAEANAGGGSDDLPF